MSVDWQQYLHILQQATDPNEPLANSVQLWMDATKHLQARIHEEGDPGANKLYKLLDFSYATFFGVEEAVTAAATVALTAGAFNLVTCTLNQDVTFNITGGHIGQEITFVLTQDATGDRAVTFGTNFEAEDVYSAGASERLVVSFMYNGSKWVEKGVSGNTVLPETRAGLILNPNAVQSADNEICIWKAVPVAITITRLEITLNSATNQVAGDLKRADTFIGLANSAVINAFDTTSGVLDDTSITSGAVGAGKCVYFSFDSAPHADITQMFFEISYTID